MRIRKSSISNVAVGDVTVYIHMISGHFDGSIIEGAVAKTIIKHIRGDNQAMKFFSIFSQECRYSATLKIRRATF